MTLLSLPLPILLGAFVICIRLTYGSISSCGNISSWALSIYLSWALPC
jgi:hypothetical protein